MAFAAKEYSVGDIMTKAVFDIPRNQRKYVWKKDNWKDLFEDIIFSINEKKPHFLGSIVLEETKKIEGLTYYTIIDGQQRITTIVLALIAVMKLFHENDMTDDYIGTTSYLKPKNNRNQGFVVINSDYHISLTSLVDGIISLADKETTISAFINNHLLTKTKDKCIGDAIQFFYSSLLEDVENAEDKVGRLVELRSAILEMTAVRIVSDSEEDSYTIFEILNARGQELAPHELLKNYIMRYIQPTEQRDIAKHIWEDMENTLGTSMNRFVKHYATHRFGDTKDKYSSPYQAIQKATRGQGIAALFEDIKLKSEYYNKIIHPLAGEHGNCSDTEARIFAFFREKKFEQFRPILLSLIHQKELKHLDDQKYEQMLKYIYNFFICYTIIGEEKSNKLEDVVFKYARLIEEQFSEALLQEFANNLKGKIPNYTWFLNAFKNVGWSNHFDLYRGDKNKRRVKLVLEVIEMFVAQSECVLDFTIEHMLPDSEKIEHSQIGNLIPLEDVLNERCGAKPLTEKFEIYGESNFKSARNTAARYKDKELVLADRTEFLARLIYNNILELNQTDYSSD